MIVNYDSDHSPINRKPIVTGTVLCSGTSVQLSKIGEYGKTWNAKKYRKFNIIRKFAVVNLSPKIFLKLDTCHVFV